MVFVLITPHVRYSEPYFPHAPPSNPPTVLNALWAMWAIRSPHARNIHDSLGPRLVLGRALKPSETYSWR